MHGVQTKLKILLAVYQIQNMAMPERALPWALRYGHSLDVVHRTRLRRIVPICGNQTRYRHSLLDVVSSRRATRLAEK